jgi:two-component system, chemotaxis family, chemotaxis protein CheY
MRAGGLVARIIIVDDALFMRKLLKDILTGAGHEVVGEGEDGCEALSCYRKLVPDLVLMDITMPGVNGIDGVRSIRSEFPDARIVMCSAMGQMNMVVESIKAGAMEFIVKPFGHDEILGKIEKCLSR